MRAYGPRPVAMHLAIHSSSTLVGLLLFACSGVTQFFPGVVCGLFWKRATAAGVAAGIITGVGVGMALVITKHDPYLGRNAGFIALCLNAAVTAIVSRATPAQTNGFEEPAEEAVAQRSPVNPTLYEFRTTICGPARLRVIGNFPSSRYFHVAGALAFG